jgi:hypothetical protein
VLLDELLLLLKPPPAAPPSSSSRSERPLRLPSVYGWRHIPLVLDAWLIASVMQTRLPVGTRLMPCEADTDTEPPSSLMELRVLSSMFPVAVSNVAN